MGKVLRLGQTSILIRSRRNVLVDLNSVGRTQLSQTLNLSRVGYEMVDSQ